MSRPGEGSLIAGLDRRTWLTVSAMSLASGMVWLSISDLSILLPTIQREFDASFSQLQWINGVSFTIALAALVVVGGRLADAYGRLLILWWGLAIFAGASAVAGLAQNADMLIIARGAQGVGAALILPATLAVIVAVVPRGSRGLPIGIWGAATALLQGAAPAIAGGLEALDVWRAVFWINLPLALLIFAMTRHAGGGSREAGASRSFDLAGTATLAIWVTGLSLLLIQGDEWGWRSVESLLVAGATIFFVVVFVLIELRAHAPLVQLPLFRNPLFSGSNCLVLTANLVLAGLMFFLALYLQDILGDSAFLAGLAFLPGAFAIAILAPIAGQLFDRRPLRWSAMPGALLFAAACAVCLGISLDGGYALALGVFLLAGAGAGFVVTYTAAGALHAAPSSQAGSASGVVAIASTLGAMLGTALTGAIFEAAAEPEFVDTAATQGVTVPPNLQDDIIAILSGSDTGTSSLASFSTSAQQVIQEAARIALVDGVKITVAVLMVLMLFVAAATWMTAKRRYFDPSNRNDEPVAQTSATPETN